VITEADGAVTAAGLAMSAVEARASEVLAALAAVTSVADCWTTALPVAEAASASAAIVAFKGGAGESDSILVAISVADAAVG
jgi:pectin methylesterase-like acyl-CoA thioesterase